MKDQNQIKNTHDHVRREEDRSVHSAMIIKEHKDRLRKAKSEGADMVDYAVETKTLTAKIGKLKEEVGKLEQHRQFELERGY